MLLAVTLWAGWAGAIQAARRPISQGPAELVPDSAAKDEQRSKKQRGTDRDGAAVKLHGLVLS